MFPEIIFLTSKKDLFMVYRAACNLAKITCNQTDFEKEFPIVSDRKKSSFIPKWKEKEKKVLGEIEKNYGKWQEGKIFVALFPTDKIFQKLPDFFQKCCCFEGVDNKIYIILYPRLINNRFSFKILIHELLHANDSLNGKVGRVDEQTHARIRRLSEEILAKVFKF